MQVNLEGEEDDRPVDQKKAQIIKEGYMRKKKPGNSKLQDMKRSWERRYFVLSVPKRTVAYYDGEKSESPKRVFLLGADCSAEAVVRTGEHARFKSNCFKLTTHNSAMYAAANSAAARQRKSTPPKCPCLPITRTFHSCVRRSPITTIACSRLMNKLANSSPSWRKTALPSPRSFSASAITAINFIATSSSCTKAASACR